MALFVVVGAGPVGRETARLLCDEGHEVRLVSRRRTELAGTKVKSVALDASHGAALAEVSRGAEAIFMCAMAPYHRWPTDFPPIVNGTVEAAEQVGARLLIAGNVYAYGELARSPLTPLSALEPTSVKGRVRVAMWERALASSVPAIEVRASDYLGNGAGSLFTLMALPSLLAGEEVSFPGDLDVLHAWSFTRDVARTLVAAARYSGEWRRAFHVPSQHASARDIASRFAIANGSGAPRLRALSRDEMIALARGDEILREVVEMYYLYEKPYVFDASDTERLLGVSASSLDTMIGDTLQDAG